MKFWYVEMYGQYENEIVFPFFSKDAAELYVLEQEAWDSKYSGSKWNTYDRRSYEIEKYDSKDGLIKFGYAE